MLLLTHPYIRPIILLLLGAITVLGFAPFYVYPVSLFSIAGFSLFIWQSNTAKRAAMDSFLFALGLYVVGIYWIYISLHDFGGMPVWMAMLATFLLCTFMASFYALMGAFAFWLWQTTKSSNSAKPVLLVLSLAVSWGLIDWIKSWIFTGFPWLTIGYTQVPNGALAGLIPILGVYGVSVLTVVFSGLLALFIKHCVVSKTKNVQLTRAIVISLICFSIIGWSSKAIDWSQPIGQPITVDLVQGNISQDLKWSPDIALETIALYQRLTLESQADLIVLPETALPILSTQLSDTLQQPFINHTKANNSNLIFGIVEYNPNTKAYFNSAISVGADPTQTYQKSHLVPFGEFIPFKEVFGWIYRDYLNMPISDMSRGTTQPQPMQLNKQKIAVNICYEDVFGEEIIRQLPEATMLLNLTNDAWYGESYAAEQHLQFSQARAMETARMVLRATNTGATTVIDPKGQLIAHAPNFTQTVLNSTAQGYTGSTPYVRFGNWPFLILSFLLIAFVISRKNQ